MQSKKWTKIGVPSCWELQGFGNYNYGRDYKADKAYHDEHGVYKHQFFVSKDWNKNEVKIVFEGVMTDAEVKINGNLAGEIHQGAFEEPVTLNSGPSTASICAGDTYELETATVSNFASFEWSTNGSGTFSPSENDLTPIYTPSAADIANGEVVLQLSAVSSS